MPTEEPVGTEKDPTRRQKWTNILFTLKALMIEEY
jgi:hypothetical protein